jgi:hypothetical protein
MQHEPRSSTPSTLSSMMARICVVIRSSTARRRWRDCSATPRLPSFSTNTLPRMGRPCSPMRASLAPRASFRSGSTAPISPARAAFGSRSGIPPASPCSGSGARFGIGDHREVIELGNRQINEFTQSRIHNGQSVKTGSSLAPTRHHFRELSDDDLTPTRLGRADRALVSVGVSWTAAGVGLCVFATISLIWACSR